MAARLALLRLRPLVRTVGTRVPSLPGGERATGGDDAGIPPARAGWPPSGAHRRHVLRSSVQGAASVIALIRERHGEPVMEFTAADGEAFHDAAAGAIDGHGVFTCAHEDAG